MNKTTAQPEFIRLPRRGQCPHSGLSRSYLNGLILPNQENGNNPPVRSVCLRKRGRLRGVRLISLHSLLDYLNGQAGVSP